MVERDVRQDGAARSGAREGVEGERDWTAEEERRVLWALATCGDPIAEAKALRVLWAIVLHEAFPGVDWVRWQYESLVGAYRVKQMAARVLEEAERVSLEHKRVCDRAR